MIDGTFAWFFGVPVFAFRLQEAEGPSRGVSERHGL